MNYAIDTPGRLGAEQSCAPPLTLSPPPRRETAASPCFMPDKNFEGLCGCYPYLSPQPKSGASSGNPSYEVLKPVSPIHAGCHGPSLSRDAHGNHLDPFWKILEAGPHLWMLTRWPG